MFFIGETCQKMKKLKKDRVCGTIREITLRRMFVLANTTSEWDMWDRIPPCSPLQTYILHPRCILLFIIFIFSIYIISFMQYLLFWNPKTTFQLRITSKHKPCTNRVVATKITLFALKSKKILKLFALHS